MGIGLSYVAGITDLEYSYMRNALRDAGCECPREVPVLSELPFILWHGVLRKLYPRDVFIVKCMCCLLYTSPSPRDVEESRMPSSA